MESEDDLQSIAGCEFNPSGIEDCEDVERYEPGGYHPVLLDDVYDGNRYKIVHKLGSGGFSTVWLARDLQQEVWVALKFIKAKDSAEYDARSSAIAEDPDLLHSDLVIHIERRFWVDGPNGHHLCLVLGLVGPNLATLSNGIYYRLNPAFAANVSLQAARAMEFLHAYNKCHGDFTANNIALALSTEFQSYGVDDIFRTFGEPYTSSVEAASDPAGSNWTSRA